MRRTAPTAFCAATSMPRTICAAFRGRRPRRWRAMTARCFARSTRIVPAVPRMVRPSSQGWLASDTRTAPRPRSQSRSTPSSVAAGAFTLRPRARADLAGERVDAVEHLGRHDLADRALGDPAARGDHLRLEEEVVVDAERAGAVLDRGGELRDL